MATLTGTIQEQIEYQREQEWKKAGVPQSDIDFSEKTGIDAGDVKVLREKSARGFLIIVRCPKKTARAHHGIFPAKIMAEKGKTGSSGLVVSRRGIFVSDYDLLSVFKRGGKDWKKIFISAANGAPRGPWTPEAGAFVRDLNQVLKSKIQHGCQDDFQSTDNPGLKTDQELAVFMDGTTDWLPNRWHGEMFYGRYGLPWVYDGNGKYNGPIAT